MGGLSPDECGAASEESLLGVVIFHLSDLSLANPTDVCVFRRQSNGATTVFQILLKLLQPLISLILSRVLLLSLTIWDARGSETVITVHRNLLSVICFIILAAIVPTCAYVM